MSNKPEKFYKVYPTTVGFPCGTLAEVIEHLTNAEKEALAAYKMYYKDHEQLGYMITRTYFDEQWSGYEDCDYYFTIVVEEKEEFYQARLAEWERINKIKELEKQLNELKNGCKDKQ